METAIKKLSPGDLPRLLELLKTVLTHDFPEYQPRAAAIYREHIFERNYFDNFLKDKNNIILGAYSRDKLIGFATIQDQWGGVYMISWLVVERAHRNQGVGSKIMDKVEEIAHETKKHCIYLYTESEKNIDYYKGRGYRYVGVMEKAWFGVDEHVMQKVLREVPHEEIFDKYLKV